MLHSPIGREAAFEDPVPVDEGFLYVPFGLGLLGPSCVVEDGLEL